MSEKYTFNFYRFIGTIGNRSTEFVRDYTLADGMRGLVDRKTEEIQLARERVQEWVTSKGITVNPLDPFPSMKYPGKAL